MATYAPSPDPQYSQSITHEQKNELLLLLRKDKTYCTE